MPTLADLHRAGLRESSPGVITVGRSPRQSTVQLPDSKPKPRRNEQASSLLSNRNCQILENRFIFFWNLQRGPELEREFRFCPSRRWRCDFAHPSTRTLIEIEGGLHKVGRHNSADGYTKDAIKYNTATLLGYRVFRLTSKMLNPETIQAIVEFVNTQPSSHDQP